MRPSICPLDGSQSGFLMPKMGNFLYEIYQGSPTLILLNVLNVLKLLNVLTFLNVLNMPKDQSLACFFFSIQRKTRLCRPMMRP